MDRVNINFRSLLKQLDGELVSDDIESIKFLSRNILDDYTLEGIKRGFDLFTQMENRQLLAERNTSYLAELLFRIGRYDLVNKLGYRTDELKQIFSGFHTKLTPFRVLLYKIAEDVTSVEVGLMKFDVQDYISRIRSNQIKTAFSLFVALEQRNVLTSSNVAILEQMLETIRRQDLLGIVRSYKEFISSGEQTQSHGVHPTSSQFSNLSSPPPTLFPEQSHSATVFPNIRPSYVDPSIAQSAVAMEAFQYTPPASEEESTGPHFEILNSTSIPTTVEEASSLPSLGSENEPEMDKYDMTSRTKGYCIIINNQNFSPRAHLKVRKGSEMDRGNLKYIWNKLGFYVVIYDNKTANEMLQIMNHFATNVRHDRHNAFVCCVLSHGKRGTVYGSDGEQVKINDLMKNFKALSCESLREKPKLFFIQACQGEEEQHGAPSPHEDTVEADTPDERPLPRTIPDEADFLLGYATVPGFVSYRSHEHGSWYITCLTMMLDRLTPRHDLLSILTRVNHEVSKQYRVDNERRIYKQVPAPQYTLTKALYFPVPQENRE